MLFWFNRFPMFLLDADGGGNAGGASDGDGSGGGDGDGDGGQGENAGGDGNNDGKSKDDSGSKQVTMTQKELDDMLDRRMARAKKKWEEEAADEKKKADMTEAEKAKAEKEEADRKAQESTTKGANKARNAEARIELVTAGVKPERIDRALKLLDLSEVEVDEDFEVDNKAVKKLVADLVKEWPELLGDNSGGAGGRGGSDFSGGGGSTGKVTYEDFAKMSLKQKTELHSTDKPLYEKLMAEYKKKNQK